MAAQTVIGVAADREAWSGRPSNSASADRSLGRMAAWRCRGCTGCSEDAGKGIPQEEPIAPRQKVEIVVDAQVPDINADLELVAANRPGYVVGELESSVMTVLRIVIGSPMPSKPTGLMLGDPRSTGLVRTSGNPSWAAISVP